MKVIIAGTRSIYSLNLVEKAVKESGFEITEVVSGGAKGIDTAGEHYAKINNIPCKVFKADWEMFGSAAGPIRNKQMSDYADALIALPFQQSKGTMNMIHQAHGKGLKVYVKEIQGQQTN